MIDIFQTDQHMCAVCSVQATQLNIVHILQLILDQVGVVGLYKCQEEELICLQKQVLQDKNSRPEKVDIYITITL